jgi:hypothetical protein
MAHSAEFYLLGTVPIANFSAAWDTFRELLIPAFAAARNTDPHTLRLQAVAGIADLWTVFRIRPTVLPAGVFFTEVIEIDNRRVLCAHTMSARNLRSWARVAQTAVETEARRRKCSVVQLMGRRGLLRIYSGYSIVGEARPGELLFEKVL